MAKKYIKSALYITFNVVNIILITIFLKLTIKAYQNGFIYGFQYYPRIIIAFIIYVFVFVHILLLIMEHTRKLNHSIWWEATCLIILFIALIANIV